MSDIDKAAERMRNSDAAGIAHQELYGYDVRSDLEILGRAYLAQQPTYAELAAENERLRKQAEHSLANNLCPDHRDKQKGKPCLACEIERLTRQLAALTSKGDRDE